MITVFYDAYQVLGKVYGQGAFVTQALNSVSIEPLKRKEITKICYGVLDKDIELSYYLTALSKKTPKLAIRTLLKIAMYSIKYLQKQPYAVVNNIVELSKKLGKDGASGFINAFLRNFINKNFDLPTDKNLNLSVKYSYPLFAVQMLLKYYGEGTAESIMGYDENHNYIRFNKNVNGQDYLKNNNFEYENTPFDNLFDVKKFTQNQDFIDGVYTFQSIGSVAICDIVTYGENVLDACSAPGGKSVLLSERFKTVLSCDVHEHRVELIKSYAERMKRQNIEAIVQDSSIFVEEFENRFDSVLCDVPCSGFGTLKENPDIKLRKTYDDVKGLSATQFDIINNCCKYVKIGGELIYSTCSIFPLENDKIIEKFLENNDNFEVVKITSPLPNLKVKYGLQFLPHISCGAGFYVAKLRKIR